MRKVIIIGDGGWGTALATVFCASEIDVTLWSYSRDYASFLDRKRENVKFLKGIRIPDGVKITSDEDEARGKDMALFAVPCEYLRSVAERFEGIEFKYIVSGAKGIENRTLKRPSEILREYFRSSRIGILSGPSISYEVARGYPTTVVLAAKDGWKKKAQKIIATERFRVYTSSDIIGVEVGGALKNVIAIASGISDGLGFGTNTKAALLTRGLAEITRLGVRMGARKETFSGLTGIGDLVTTCMSSHSRNRWFGEELGRGRKVKDIVRSTEMVVEGIATSESAYELSRKYKVDMPITEKVYGIVHKGKDPRKSVRELMTRGLKGED